MVLLSKARLALLMAVIMTTLFTIMVTFSTPSHADKISKGSYAPDFRLPVFNGPNLRLNEHKGDVILLNFWASWCGPCRQELPALNKLQDEFQKLGFKVLAVSLDTKQRDVAAFLKDTPVKYPVLLDTDQKVSERYDLRAMPTTYILDRDHKVRYVHYGFFDSYIDKYRDEIKTLVME